ncbi:hypothetical protein B0E48_11240 [Rhodanobacter sp. C03]|nr:hypothetical protein B0E48_11240 [Rhodanobacter sp. C03]
MFFALPVASADWSTPSATQSVSAPKADPSVPADLRDTVVDATVKGFLLYRNDTASAIASDTMVDSGALKEVAHPTGWLTNSEDAAGDLWSVAFTEDKDGKPYAFADATVQFVDGKPRVSFHRNKPARPIAGTEAIEVQVRDLAMKVNVLRCAPQYNQAVMLWQEHGNLFANVDLLPARTDADTYYLGGFHELRYTLKGDAPPSHFAQTKSCITVTKEPANSVAMVVTHLTSPTPTQFHVFMSLSYHKTIYVLTTQNHLKWAVEAGHIRIVKEDKS